MIIEIQIIRFARKIRLIRTDGKAFSADKYRSLLTIEEAKALGIEVPKKKVEVKYVNVYPDDSMNAHRTGAR